MAESVPGGWEFVAFQLQREKALFGYRYVAVNGEWDIEATNKLAQHLYSLGIADIRDLALYIGTERTPDTTAQESYDCGDGQCTRDVVIPGKVLPVWWLYNRKTNARVASPGESGVPGGCVTRYIGESELPETQCVPQPGPTGPVAFAKFTLPDQNGIDFAVQFVSEQKVAVFVPKFYRRETGWEAFRFGVLFIFSAFALAIPGLGPVISSYVLGTSFVAAYPALASIITQAAFNAVLGGMDIEHAVGRALAGYAGAQAGQFAGGQFDSTLIAKTTAAATTALLTGADVEKAVGMATLQYAGTLTQSLSTAPAPNLQPKLEPAMDFDAFTAEELVPEGFQDLGFDASAFAPDQYLFDNTGVNPDSFVSQQLDTSSFGGDSLYDVTFEGSDDFVGPPEAIGDLTTYSGGALPANLPPQSPSDMVNDQGWGWDDALSKVTQAALAALQVYKVYQAVGSPPIKSAGPSQTVNRTTGTITTTSPTGMTSTGKPPVGQPVAAADGSLIVNNGNGTYTVIGTDGSRTTRNYPDAAGTGSMLAGVSNQQLLLYGGLGLGAVFLLMRK